VIRSKPSSPLLLPRRQILRSSAAAAAAALVPAGAFAQEEERPFSFETLTEDARARAAAAYEAPYRDDAFAEGLGYDDYRRINYSPERARFAEEGSRFRLAAFHLGWLFAEPVHLYEVADGTARLMSFTTDDFLYYDGLPFIEGALPGVSGFRLASPINRPGAFDEVIAFQGASYFRALGRGNAYGLSARGLAIDTATGRDEEFPRFSAFYVEHPVPGSNTATIYADLDSRSVAGAYRFLVTPGEETHVEVTARLFFREEVEHLGVAPLTSMFLYDDTDRTAFDDYRPRVHDSDGLRVTRASGDVLWRALKNPPRLANSYFRETNPRAFGLHQRDRDYEDFQDAGAHYHERPSLEVEPIGDWGEGVVRLVEIPADLEIHDNIAAYWLPDGTVAAGGEREYAYRLRWGMLPPRGGELAYVASTKAGVGGVSGVPSDGRMRKFVVDFLGDRLGGLPPDAKIEANVAISRGTAATEVLSKVPGMDMWRLAIDVAPEGDAPVELVAFIEGFGERLSETWLYQWIPTA
jgi:glucans biosynthesis protein